jgi:hypothetical protein
MGGFLSSLPLCESSGGEEAFFWPLCFNTNHAASAMAMTPTSAAPMPMPAFAPAESWSDDDAELEEDPVFEALFAAEESVGAPVLLVEVAVAVAEKREVVKSFRSAR